MKSDHEAEFTAFVTGATRRLLHAGDLLTGDRARAEDLVQNAFAKAYLRWPAIRENHPEAYVRRSMLNNYLDWWRRRRLRELPLPVEPVEWAPQGAVVADHAAAVARRDAVQRALATLTRRERAVVVLRFWLDLSEAQIAEELQMARGTVKSTCARALGKLRIHLDVVSPDCDARETPRSESPFLRNTPVLIEEVPAHDVKEAAR